MFITFEILFWTYWVKEKILVKFISPVSSCFWKMWLLGNDTLHLWLELYFHWAARLLKLVW